MRRTCRSGVYRNPTVRPASTAPGWFVRAVSRAPLRRLRGAVVDRRRASRPCWNVGETSRRQPCWKLRNTRKEMRLARRRASSPTLRRRRPCLGKPPAANRGTASRHLSPSLRRNHLRSEPPAGAPRHQSGLVLSSRRRAPRADICAPAEPPAWLRYTVENSREEAQTASLTLAGPAHLFWHLMKVTFADDRKYESSQQIRRRADHHSHGSIG